MEKFLTEHNEIDAVLSANESMAHLPGMGRSGALVHKVPVFGRSM
jgi:hypothetical protein